MKTKFEITKPKNVECTLEVTMPLKEWIMLADSLKESGKYPGWKLAGAINKLISKATESFTSTENLNV